MRKVLPPIVVGVLAILAWELTVSLGRIAPFILPAPSAIWRELMLQRGNVWDAALASGLNALIGLAGGAVLGVLAALVSSRSRTLSEVSVPIAAVLNALPIIALAPILNNMFESTSSVPRRIVTAIIVFFPVFINTLRGLREVDPVHRELMTSYAASTWTFARKVRLPGALPFVFTGLRQASSLAVIAAVVAEYFGGLQDGLGARIT
ncbi:ABC transporter permease subunit, partial [Actinoplanes sp. NPDC051633]|uniref:ABC transporter permease n=1 Tax=Actinoplanes sp. NPDC051633 TaxID=3155670 RepID=UPI00341ACCA8